MTFRAINVLKEVDLILAEDTRTSKKLLMHFGIDKPLLSHHLHNEHKTVESLTQRLAGGETMALISDAGTPAISDPGFLLVRACVAHKIDVECLPGATAIVPALVESGLPVNKFHFEGFLPHKKGRQTRLKWIAEHVETTVLYESPHRLVKLMGQLEEFCGPERQISVSREISKKFAETIRGTVLEVKNHFESNPVKGEIVVVVSGQKS
jgi:16S rRNA (cytidine1402-2'-O)-methyltransferase